LVKPYLIVGMRSSKCSRSQPAFSASWFVGEAVSLDLRVRPPARYHRRHVGNVQQLGREHSPMPSNQRALFVDEHRVGEAKFTDRGSDLLYLIVGMRRIFA
jgi:hypothetical protein